MSRNFTLLPIACVVVIAVLALIAISSERSNLPDITGNPDYPHHVCKFDNYCQGAECSPDRGSFIAYLSHSDGEPRLIMSGVSPRATLQESPSQIVFETTGGDVSGTLIIYSDREFDFLGQSSVTGTSVDHVGTGQCQRRVRP